MRITFVTPGYQPVPSGGMRVVYEYANRLVARGHEVTVVHPRRLASLGTPEKLNVRDRAREAAHALFDLFARRSPNWQPIDNRVKLLFVPTLAPGNIPDGDAIFATAWKTVRTVLECSEAKGEKCYLIQGYETWMGPKDLVDYTWRAPLHKLVVSRWLLELGKALGVNDMSYIPNAIDHERYCLIHPIEGRSPRVAMVFSKVSVKGAADGIEALRVVRAKYPYLKAAVFGLTRFRPSIPKWIEYHKNPPQEFIIREIYNRSSIFLCPSLSEGSPLPPAEAAACGCAIVSTDNGGIREYIEHGLTGLLSAPQNPQALAENLGLLLENEDLRVRLAKASQRLVAQLSWERSADLMQGFIIGVVNHKVIEQQRNPTASLVDT